FVGWHVDQTADCSTQARRHAIKSLLCQLERRRFPVYCLARCRGCGERKRALMCCIEPAAAFEPTEARQRCCARSRASSNLSRFLAHHALPYLLVGGWESMFPP